MSLLTMPIHFVSSNLSGEYSRYEYVNIANSEESWGFCRFEGDSQAAEQSLYKTAEQLGLHVNCLSEYIPYVLHWLPSEGFLNEYGFPTIKDMKFYFTAKGELEFHKKRFSRKPITKKLPALSDYELTKLLTPVGYKLVRKTLSSNFKEFRYKDDLQVSL